MGGKQDTFYAKLVAFSALAYLIYPIDLIPDFIPIAGYFNDLIIAPLLIHVAFTFLPFEVLESGRAQAKKSVVKLYIVFFIVLALLLIIMVLIFFLIRSLLHL